MVKNQEDFQTELNNNNIPKNGYSIKHFQNQEHWVVVICLHMLIGSVCSWGVSGERTASS